MKNMWRSKLRVSWGSMLGVPIFFVFVIYATYQALGQTPTDQSILHFSYRLKNSCRTSAGVFDPRGSLVRTLWSNKNELAGDHDAFWDGIDDIGGSRLSHDSRWNVRVLCSRVVYRWDGVIGNTEAAWTSRTDIWDGLGYKPTQLKLTFLGDSTIWISTGYSEGTINLLRLNASSPNQPQIPDTRFANQNVQFVDIDSDYSHIYLANAAVWNGNNFITKMDGSSRPVSFRNGRSISFPQSWKGIPLSGIDVSAKGESSPSALAVQAEGNVLAVAYSSINTVKFFDKDNGVELGNPLRIDDPTSMGFTSSGLWILSGNSVYLIKDVAGRNVRSSPIRGLANPVYLTTNKRTGNLFVLDGGSSQQVKEFDVHYALIRTYGDRGGYTDWNPTITSTRLMLDDTATTGQPTGNGSWIRVSPDDQLWICDGGNAGRILHISSSNKYIDRILFSQETYAVGVSRTVPSRLFRGTIEYRVNYGRRLQPGDPDPKRGGTGSWEMVRNWAVGAEGANGSRQASYDTYSPSSGVLYAERLKNGRVYGHIRDPKSNLVREIEFPVSATVPIRFTEWQSPVEVPMQVDGSLLKIFVNGANDEKTIVLQRAQLTGFTPEGNPVRDAFVTLIQDKYDPSREPAPLNGWGMSSFADPTSEGVYPIYLTQPFGEIGQGRPRFHLGGLLPGRTGFTFLANPEGCVQVADGHGTWPCANSFGGHNGIGVQAIDRNIFATYDGQYAKYGQQVFHYWTDGLMVGQFGQSSFGVAGKPRPPGSGGNIAMMRFVKVAKDVYLYMSVEAGYTPIQRWRISNLDSVFELTGSGGLRDRVHLVSRVH